MPSSKNSVVSKREKSSTVKSSGIGPKLKGILDIYQNNPSQLISILQDVQTELGYLPKEALVYVSENLGIPLTRVYSVATFFRAFSLKPRGKNIITCCVGTACHVRGASKVLDRLGQELCIEPGETSADMKYTLETVNCLGACALGPIVVVNGEYNGDMTPDKVKGLLKKYD